MQPGPATAGTLDRAAFGALDELYAVAFAATIDPDRAVAAVHDGIGRARSEHPQGSPTRVELIACVLTAAIERAPAEAPVPADLLAAGTAPDPAPPGEAAGADTQEEGNAAPVIPDQPAAADDLVAVAMTLGAVLPAWDRAVLQLSLRHDIDATELAGVLDRVPGTVGNDVQAARDHIETLIGSALFVHVARSRCEGLDAAVASLPASPGATELAERVDAHLAECEPCRDRRRGLVPAVSLLAGIEIPPAPPSLRWPVPPPRRNRLPRPGRARIPAWRRVLVAGVAAAIVGLTVGVVLAVTTRSVTHDETAAGSLTTASAQIEFGTAVDVASLPVTNESATDIHYDARAAVPWLSVSPASATIGPGGNLTLSVSLDRSAAPEGENRTEVRIESARARVVVPATAVVERAPVIGTLTAVSNQLGAANCPAPTDTAVSVRVVEESGLASVQLHTRVGSARDTASTMTDDQGVQRGVLGPFPPGTITWWVTATDVRNNTASSPEQTLTVTPC